MVAKSKKGINLTNEILRRRIVKMMALSYALSEEKVWEAYKRVNSIDIILNLLEINKLQDILKIEDR